MMQSLTFNNAKGILINGLTSINSQLYHVVINGCRDVRMDGLKIVAPGDSPNTDGIHVQRSTGVVVIGTGIKTGDDCISVGPGTKNLWVEDVACGPGHGIRLGRETHYSNYCLTQNGTWSVMCYGRFCHVPFKSHMKTWSDSALSCLLLTPLSK